MFWLLLILGVLLIVGIVASILAMMLFMKVLILIAIGCVLLLALGSGFVLEAIGVDRSTANGIGMGFAVGAIVLLWLMRYLPEQPKKSPASEVRSKEGNKGRFERLPGWVVPGVVFAAIVLVLALAISQSHEEERRLNQEPNKGRLVEG